MPLSFVNYWQACAWTVQSDRPQDHCCPWNGMTCGESFSSDASWLEGSVAAPPIGMTGISNKLYIYSKRVGGGGDVCGEQRLGRAGYQTHWIVVY